MRLFLMMLALSSLTACITPGQETGSTSDAPYMVVNSIPQGATITFADGVTCETPCRVLVRQPLAMKIAKAGYRAGDVTLTTNRAGEITYRLEQAAPTTAVEQDQLPDL
ncbi:MAG: PEGA domain-containing protein [Parvularculaceae bacterium]